MKKILTLLLILATHIAIGQIIAPDNRIIVLGDASIELPANQVTFSVNLFSADSVSLDAVYENQRKLEANIYTLLKDLKVPSKDISYSLLAVRRDTDYETKREYYVGQQHVTFTLDSIRRVPDIQAKLIRAGFSQFSSDFASTEMEKHKKALLEKAVLVAKTKATVLANASDRKIKRIVKIADTDEGDYTFSNYGDSSYAVAAASVEGYLTEIPQTVSISTRIKVTFELK